MLCLHTWPVLYDVYVLFPQLVELHQSGAGLMGTDQCGMTALHHAARFGHKDIVKYLIEQGIQTNQSTTVNIHF